MTKVGFVRLVKSIVHPIVLPKNVVVQFGGLEPGVLKHLSVKNYSGNSILDLEPAQIGNVLVYHDSFASQLCESSNLLINDLLALVLVGMSICQG